MRSVGSIAKITKAMKMVDTAKMKIEVIKKIYKKLKFKNKPKIV